MTTDKHKEACKYFMEELKPEPQAQSVEADGYAICDSETGKFEGDFYNTLESAEHDFGDAANYIIRPVKLLFLDEGKCKKE